MEDKIRIFASLHEPFMDMLLNDTWLTEEPISLDENRNPIFDEQKEITKLGDDLDVPGSSADDEMEKIGSEDEENNYYSLSDNEDDHEEENDDLLE